MLYQAQPKLMRSLFIKNKQKESKDAYNIAV